MPNCAYGSEPKAGSPVWDSFSDANIIASFGSIAGWLTSWALGLPTAPFLVADFCAVEPNADLPTAADYAKLFFPPLALASGTYTRFKNQLLQWKFNDLCECSLPPSGTCEYLLTHPYSGGSTTGSLPGAYYFIERVTPSANLTLYGVWANFATIGSGSLRVFVRAQNVSTELKGETFSGVTGDHLYTFTTPYNLTSGTHYDIGVQTGGASWNINYAVGNCTPFTTALAAYGHNGYNDAGTFPPADYSGCLALDTQVCLTSGSGPGGEPYPAPPALDPPTGFPDPPSAVTCSVDQDICDLLNTISQKLDWMRIQVDLIQRQGVPFGYLLGTMHSGLTGSGTLAVSDVLGCVVTYTTVPSYWGQSSDSPSRYIPAPGSIAFGSADGVTQTTFINLPTEIVVKPSGGWSTSIDYHFKAGVTASIQELLREP